MKKTLQEIYQQLGVRDRPRDVFTECDPKKLMDAGVDAFGRKLQMEVHTYENWCLMQRNAADDGVDIQVVSAYRSYQYQSDIIQRKLNSGQSLTEITKVSALPGLSEHHTGRALDLTTCDEQEVLTEAFENTPAFQWLSKNAHRHHFILSYSRNNNKGFVYEPWHWCYQGK